MIEHGKPSLGIGVDDVNTGRCIRLMECLELPFQANVIVVDDPNRKSVDLLVREFGSRLRAFRPVIHVSLFTGIFLKDNRGMFGENGILHRVLHGIEHTPAEHRERHLQHWMNRNLSGFLKPHERYIIDEIHRQAEYWKQISGYDTAGLSYHWGLHMVPPVHSLYVKAAREMGVPCRYAADRLGVPKKGHVAVRDGLNYSGVDTRAVLNYLAEILKIGNPAEVTLHLAEWEYGFDQFRAFNHPSVRSMLTNFKLETPSDMWRRSQYPQAT